jgi:hypothetical protein
MKIYVLKISEKFNAFYLRNYFTNNDEIKRTMI